MSPHPHIASLSPSSHPCLGLETPSRSLCPPRRRQAPLLVLALFLLFPVLLRAQNQGEGNVQANTGYPVTGRVLCGDTQRPARFAVVQLVSADPEEGRGRGGTSARTDLDGNFLIPAVAPGDYFVAAQLPGYINEAPLLQMALSAHPDAPSIPAGVPKIRVGTGGASAQLTLQRGATLSGSVQWDDGSPAAGVGISTVSAAATNSGQASFSGFVQGGFGGNPAFNSGSQTDDRGHFRLSGIAAGAYLVRATVQAPAPATSAPGRPFARTLSLNVYAPDKLRRTDATVVTLAAGEERGDLTLVMNLAALHSVAGTVSSTAAPVRSGTVTLTDAADSSLTRTGIVNADGSFLVPYVPSGNYTLRASVSSAAQSFGRGNQTTSPATVRFQPLQESLTVTDSDLTGLSLNVTAATGGSQ